tara:strand:+ start:222 stop:644 length:423 start_codon:yes stop_codon:yes gene_type:complete
MGEEFYAIIKLVSGEEIMALVMPDDSAEETILIVQNPLIMKMQQNTHGYYIKVKPWLELTTEDCFMIKLDRIITMTETTDNKIIHFYNKFLEDSIAENSIHIPMSGKIKPDAKMGYISSVDKSRKELEDVFKLEIESKES